MQSIAIQAALLGVLNHVLFHYREPSPAQVPLAVSLLALEPLVVCFIFIDLGYSSWSFLNLTTTYTSFFLALASSIMLYRLSPFHPLAKIPGPILMKISKFYLACVSRTGKRHVFFKELHDKYGRVVRTGPNEISVIDVNGIDEVLGVHGLPKGKTYAVRQNDHTLPQSLINTSSNVEHAKRRRLWTRGMNMQAIQEYEPIVVRRGQQLGEELEKRSKLENGTATLDLVEWMNYFTFDFMSDMAFGGGSEMLRDGGDKKGLWHSLEERAIYNDFLGQVPWLSYLAHKIFNNRLGNIGVEWAMSRVKRGTLMKDLWYYLTDEAGLEKEKPSLAQTASDGVVAIVAGSDTTSGVMAGFFWFMMSNPEYYKRVQEEVDRVYPAGSDPMDISKHPELHFLSACIDETLRLLPPVPTNGPREVPSGSGGKIVVGHFLPEGTQVYVPPYVVHRDPGNFSSPDEFYPERWLQVQEGSRLNPIHNHDTKAYIPFSYGPRNCVGRGLARREMLMVLSMLIQRMVFEFADGFDAEAWPTTLDDFYVSTRGPLRVKVALRK